MSEDTKLPKLTEFETKYSVEGDLQHPFKALVGKLDFDKFQFVQGPDTFFFLEGRDDIFARYRKAEHGDKRAWWTIKQKTDPKNNINRKEPNWDVTNTPFHEILAGAQMQGWIQGNTIWKECHIYTFKDANLVFYTVRANDKYEHFIEIEMKEGLDVTEEEAWNIIRGYEDILSPLGINHRKRLHKSLYEMYGKND